MTSRLKMIVGGLCNLVVLVAFALLLVVLSENRVVHRVLASAVVELSSDRVVLSTGGDGGDRGGGTFVGKKEPVPLEDPNEIPRTFFAFRGIPYAKPPLGELRWQPPQPVELRQSPHQAAEFKPGCPQWSARRRKVVGATDCLYLNIFTSYIPSPSKRRLPTNSTSSWTVENPNLLPVLVYIHGGEFLSGNPSKFSPDALIKRERVVVVTLNFRLGVLGFLSTGTEDLPGNYGLQDQLAALRWIQKYIHRFGGNPLRVTVFGSVEYLLLAKGENEKEHLFHAAILRPQSTSLLGPFPKVGSVSGGRNFAIEVASHVGCEVATEVTNASLRLMAECLRNADVDTLIRSQNQVLALHNVPVAKAKAWLGPVVDHVLLEDEPEVLFATGRFREVPLMIGLSANEGFNPFVEFYLKVARKAGGGVDEVEEVLRDEELVKSTLEKVVEAVMVGVPDLEENGSFDRVFQSIWSYYFGGMTAKDWNSSEGEDQVVNKLFKLFGDMFVNTGHCKLLQALSSNAKVPVFAYLFNHGMPHFPTFFQDVRRHLRSDDASPDHQRAKSSYYPKSALHLSLNTPWEETYYLFHPIDERSTGGNLSNIGGGGLEAIPLTPEDIGMTDALARIWVSFAKYAQPKQALEELPEYGRWVRMEPGQRSISYFLISNQPLQRGMRSDFKKAECQFWMSTVPQVRTLSKAIGELEPFPLLFWISVAVVVLFALIIVTLIVLICWARHRQGSYGRGDGIYLHHARQL